MELSELILASQFNLDEESMLVMNEIAGYVYDELEEYADSSSEERAHLIWMLHLLFHSSFPEFVEYFRGYYATPDNNFHQMNIESGLTSVELYEFLEKVDWLGIYEACRSGADIETVANLFISRTGFDYLEERQRYPVEKWDGSPRWRMVDGRYVASE